jgi:taurine--2-oxoglutarate transaminase
MMDGQEIVDLCLKHTLYSWSATGAVDPLPIVRAEGVYMHTADGRRILDFNSQLMSVNIGHSHPRVVARMKAACDRLLFAHPGTATEIRARLSKRLADLCPGNLDVFFFTLGGAEANENAIRAAKAYTGRPKILSRYRSYHGGTNAMLQLTGDPRRWANEPGMPGVVRVMDPQPYNYSFGDDPESITRNNLAYLEEVIAYEGPQTIAAMIVETVTGTNGILIPPPGYLAGLKALLSRHGILLICDEVMAGFGRTGKLFAFEHGGILPDIVTMAKGLTSSYVPLGAVALSQPIADHFQKNVFWGGLTYNAHPFCLEVADAVLDVLLEEGLVENAARLEPVMRGEMERLAARHPSVAAHRNIGLFGIVELRKDSKGTPIAGYNSSHPAMGRFAKRLTELGLYTVVRWNNFMTNPPLSITEAELREGFAILDQALAVVDEVYEG